MTVTVRLARNTDFDALLDLVERWIPEINPDGFALDPDANILRASLWSRHATAGNALIVMENDAVPGELVGALGLVFHGWGAAYRATWLGECLWYVRQEFSGYAKNMVLFAKKIGRENDIKHLTMSTNRLSSARGDKGTEFLMAMGFKPLYTVFEIPLEADHV